MTAAWLQRIAERYPIVLHGVSLSIASTAAFDPAYLRDLKALADRTQPVFVSDHLCWTGVHGINLHDLLPIPFKTEEVARVAVFLASDQASYVTGAIIAMDGGQGAVI